MRASPTPNFVGDVREDRLHVASPKALWIDLMVSMFWSALILRRSYSKHL
jgi:hypothetical protein